jgi:uncharacterized protein YndB with AHSA1/START domain
MVVFAPCKIHLQTRPLLGKHNQKIKSKKMKTAIMIEATIAAPIDKIWRYWTEPEHIKNWSFASDDWCTPATTNDLRVGGKFNSRMEAKDGSMGFDFWGTYTVVKENEKIEYTLGDGREIKIDFVKTGDKYNIVETFDAEDENPVEMQRDGWQAILNNFKKYVEE